MSSVEQEPKMGPVALALYGAILCVHYPLKLTLVTLEKSKDIVVSTASLPGRALDTGLQLTESVKQTVKPLLPHNLISAGIKQLKNLAEPQTEANNVDGENHRAESDQDQPDDSTSLVQKSENVILFAINIVSTVVTTIKETLDSTTSSIRHFLNKNFNNVFNLTQNSFNSILSVVKLFKQTTQNHAHQNNVNGEAELTLAAQIIKLQEELKRSQRNNVDNERIKCDKQIHDLQDQLSQMHLTYTQQTQNLQAEIDKERLQYEQVIAKLKEELKQAHFNYEQCCHQLTQKFHTERIQYQDELQKLLDRTGQLRTELEKYEVHEDESTENPYVVETLKTIDNIKKLTHGFKSQVVEFIGNKTDKEFLHLNEKIIKNIISLDAVESKGFNILKKKRLEVLNLNQKVQEELKNKS